MIADLEKKTIGELLAVSLSLHDPTRPLAILAEELVDTVADDLHVLWLAQQSGDVQADDFGNYVTRLQFRTEVARELMRRARDEASEQADAH